MLQYHAKSFQLIGLQPQLSPGAMQTIARYEAEHGVVIPAAVREFYLVGGDKLLGARAEEEIVGLDEFLQNVTESLDDTSPEELRCVGLTTPLYNHSYEIGLILDGSDDPWVDPNMGLDPPGPFSSFILTLAWDRITPRTLNVVTGSRSNADYAVRFGPPHVDFFLEEFEGLPTIRSGPVEPELFAFGFFRLGWRVEVLASGDPRVSLCPAEYRLFASAEEGLLDLYSFVWPCHGGPVVINLQNGWSNDSARLAALTTQFRARFPGVEITRKLESQSEQQRRAADEKHRRLEEWIDQSMQEEAKKKQQAEAERQFRSKKS
jgi:hypothetical protein